MPAQTQPLDAEFHSIQAEPVSETNELAQRHSEMYDELALVNHFAHLEHVPQRLEHGIVICRDCTNPIPAARLTAQPHAVRCIDCQTHYEKG